MTEPFNVSRRGFTKVLGAGAVFAALRPVEVLANHASVTALNQAHLGKRVTAVGAVRLSSNENPYGPSPAALRAMTDAFSLAWRYPDEAEDPLIEELMRINGVSRDQILLGAGSSEILKIAAVAFTGPDRKLIVADPTFEAIAHHASSARAEVIRVPLSADYSHDLSKMLAVINGVGLVYICNPNNPTATITEKTKLREFLRQTPRQTIVLIDEAYHHYADSADYESAIPLVKDFPNLVVARTFSKIYGMAGLRCGYCVAQSENIRRMNVHQAFDSVNIMALVAALASLKDKEHEAQSRQSNSEVKKYVNAELDKLGFRSIPSQANFMMIDLRREARPVIFALREKNVAVGRFFAPLPTHMRVTIGTRPQMETFISAFRQVMS